MENFKKINSYFFDSEKISLHDFLWFYGIVFLGLSVTLITLISYFIKFVLV